MESETSGTDKRFERRLQGGGNPNQGVEGDVLLAPFHGAYVVAVTIRVFGKFLLRQAEGQAALANGSSKAATLVSWVTLSHVERAQHNLMELATHDDSA